MVVFRPVANVVLLLLRVLVLAALGILHGRTYLSQHIRLRTACDFTLANGDGAIAADAPDGFELPPLAELETSLPAAIAACKDKMAGVTTVQFKQ